MADKAVIVFKGWIKGMRKIPFALLLKDKAGLSLKGARAIKDQILDNEVIELPVADISLAYEILNDARELGVACDLK